MELRLECPTEVTYQALRGEVDGYHVQEQETLRALGLARLQDLPGLAHRRALSEIRERLEAAYAALRILESQQGRKVL